MGWGCCFFFLGGGDGHAKRHVYDQRMCVCVSMCALVCACSVSVCACACMCTGGRANTAHTHTQASAGCGWQAGSSGHDMMLQHAALVRPCKEGCKAQRW